ncbi:Related to collagenase [hydrothermal vent metagenome]|uniref:Related to collagenase n=1 Tax=hydrothermal vent metagenome TaxID=652676 RepID=A0A3B1ANY2_9ZZZZ
MNNEKQIELLAPGGDVDAIKAAIVAGANAVYCGLNQFNARSQAKNISLDDLNGVLRLAHNNNCHVFLTLNIIIVETEFPKLFELLNKLANTTLDGIIIQDLGVFYILNKYFPTLNIHASTQMTTHNEGQIQFLTKLNATRVNLSRELTLAEITSLTAVAHKNNMLTEVFVHGSNCISFSGLCYMSSVTSGNSGNRGQCSQPCRDEYLTTAQGKTFPLNIKDNSAFSDISLLAQADVDSVKIEGRIKQYHYVYSVTETWRNQLDSFYANQSLTGDNTNLRNVFNRDFSNSFLKGTINRDVFIDSPRDNSAIHRVKVKFGEINSNITHNISDEQLSVARQELYDIKADIKTTVKNKINAININKAPLLIHLSGQAGEPLTVLVKSPELKFTLQSSSHLKKINLSKNSSSALDAELFLKKFKPLKNSEYLIENLNLDKLGANLSIPFKELITLRNDVLFNLNSGQHYIDNVDFKNTIDITVKKLDQESVDSNLSLLISSKKDISLCSDSQLNIAEVYFQIPNHLNSKLKDYIKLFKNNSKLTPWFPAVLIGQHYLAAVEFLKQVKPNKIVTNNTGIAFAAFNQGISWVAGPYMNLVNSYSLLCLKEQFNCSGAFISNELSQKQIRKINKPSDFTLTYSISHPIVLMTTIACMFHQVSGCKKNIVDDKCIQRCKKSDSITNLKNITYFIDKDKNGYHTVYNEANFLNTDIISDISGMFDNYFIDLRDIETNTKVALGKSRIIQLFKQHINGNSNAMNQLQQNINPSTNSQYQKGI